jgi:Zn-dependent protease
MNFFNYSFPIGKFVGINVRVHFLFLIFALGQISNFGNHWQIGVLYLSVLWVSVLLHEFGHALVARWCDGVADEIILWPLGGLALCRPVFNPVAHLLTAIGGPFVSLVLFGISYVSLNQFGAWIPEGSLLEQILFYAYEVNLMLLTFNMIPAFPMDGGRILRDLLWLKFGVDKATSIAVGLTKIIVIASVPLVLMTHGWWFSQNYTLIILAFFMYSQAAMEQSMLHWEGRVQPFSIIERFKRKRRQNKFQESISQVVDVSFHRCSFCGKTEHDSKELMFRVASDGHEYCLVHLPKKAGS